MPTAPQAPRPRTTTRDPAELQRRLAAWVADWLPGATVGGLTVPPSNGMSSETVLFDLRRPDGTVQPCVLRLAADTNAYAVFPHYDMERQYRAIQLVAERTKVPVPRLLRLETDPAPLGAAGFVMERLEGRVPPDVMPYTYGGNWLFDATGAERARLEQATLEVLAGLHAVPAEQAAFLAPPGSPGPGSFRSPLRRHVDQQRDYYAWVVRGRPRSPLIERAFARLEQLWPQDAGPTVLSWGDARVNNVIYRDFAPAALLDWEMAGLGPREIDIAWLVGGHRVFQDIAGLFGSPGMPHFLRLEDVVAQYEAATGHPVRDIDFYLTYTAIQWAIVFVIVGLRRVRFGEQPMPGDVHDLIINRGPLEQMLAGGPNTT